MKTGQLRRIKEVFQRLQYVAEDCREAEARETCADDAEVLADVLRLARAQRRVISGRGQLEPHQSADEQQERGADSDHSGVPGGAAIAPAPKTGDVVLGRYELRDMLGVGGFGAVHRAHDRVTRELVAIKSVALKDNRLRNWHVRETASLRRARVPGVVDLLATGEERGWAILVMSLVDGHPFPGEGIAVGDAAAILPRAVSLLEALGNLHSAGVYHRDLKSSNVLVSSEGRVTLVDLGIAQDETDASRWLPDAPIAGTLDYMAPERFRGERAGARSDLYAVGVMLIEALTGELPVRASGEAATREREKVAAALSRVTSTVVQRLVLSLVALDPRDRPADTWEALDALRESLGPRHVLELPRLGGDEVVRVIVGAAREGRSLDVVGAPGSGRTRALADAECELRAAGLLVNWVRRATDSEADAASRAILSLAATPDELDRALCDSIRRRVVDGLVLLADDFDLLDAPTRALVESLRADGAVIRVVRTSDGACVHIPALRPADLEPLVRGHERLFHVPTETAKTLWRRTRGRPRDLAREVRSWCATGLASWDGALEVSPKQLDRLRSMASRSFTVEAPGGLSVGARDAWDALTLIGEPVVVAALAEVLKCPQRVVAGEVEALIRADIAEMCPDSGRIELVSDSPHLVEIPMEERRVWSERAASHLPARSEARFRHLVASEQYDGACRAALDIAAAQSDAGNVPAAIAVLDPALAIARRHLHGRIDLYADLLASVADAALMRGTRTAVDLALYHANLAPEREGRAAAWTAVLEAAAAVLDSNARRALDILDAAGDLPTEAHRRALHVVATLAGRMSRDIDTQRRRVGSAAAWARRGGGGRDARALASSSTGWLRFEQGNFHAAYRLHARAARLTRRSRSRVTALCDAAMAAIEAGELRDARSLADDALRASRRGVDSVNEARAELLLRQCAYRDRAAPAVDEELLNSASGLDRGGTRGALRLTEAAVAWRARRLSLGGALAWAAADDLRASGFEAGALLAAALGVACGERADPELLALFQSRAERLEPAGLVAQATALAFGTFGAPALSEPLLLRARKWAREAPLPDTPREVLSPAEAASRLDPVRLVAPKGTN